MPALNVVINLYKLTLLPTPSIDKAFHIQSQSASPSAVLTIRTIGYWDNRVNVQSVKFYLFLQVKGISCVKASLSLCLDLSAAFNSLRARLNKMA